MTDRIEIILSIILCCGIAADSNLLFSCAGFILIFVLIFAFNRSSDKDDLHNNKQQDRL